MTFLISFIFLFIAMSPAFCSSIHFYQEDSGVVLDWHHPHQPYQSVEMKQEEGNWWTAEKIPLGVEFHFHPKKGRSVSLGGVLGQYPHPTDCEKDFASHIQEIWVKDGIVFPYNPGLAKPSDFLTVLTLNLHTYQETNQNEKFDAIVAAIHGLKADVFCLQECAQNHTAAKGKLHFGKFIRQDNMAKIITDRLKEKHGSVYQYFWDWSHLGFDTWEEGPAVLTSFRIRESDSRYISSNQEKTFWKSRNIVFTELDTPLGEIQVFSVHMGWWDDKEEPFKQQMDKLIAWQRSKQKPTTAAVLLCGDFNEPAGKEGYRYTVENGRFIDTYAACLPFGMLDPTIGGNIDGWKNGDQLGKRIDYIFLTEGAKLNPVLSQRIFTEHSFGRVSDHVGVYTFFKR